MYPLTAFLCNEFNNVVIYVIYKIIWRKRDSKMFGCKNGHESLACTDSEVCLLSVHYKLAILSTSYFLTLIMGRIKCCWTKNLHSITSGLSKFWARENLFFQPKIILRAASGLSNYSISIIFQIFLMAAILICLPYYHIFTPIILIYVAMTSPW